MIIPEAVLSNHIAMLGKTGSGKTSTEKLVIEQVAAEGYRVCVLDTIKSDWWGITSSADGTKPGLPFKILGGPRGHVPLHSSAGAVIGRLVGEGKLPLSIVDMADFEPGGVQRFFVDFAQSLMRHMRGVVFLVIEEAHEVAPKERAGFGAENLSIHWAKKLATAGRSKGIRMVLATQRVQSLHNALLGSCETVIAHRLTTPADQKPVNDWLKANTDKKTAEAVSQSLSSLRTGTGWLCSGEARIFDKLAFPKFATFDNTATPTADSEEIHVETAAVDQDELSTLIGDAVKEAAANDPKLLKAEIARLASDLAAANSGATAAMPEYPDLRGALDQMEKRALAAESTLSEFISATNLIERGIADLGEAFGYAHACRFGADQHLTSNGWEAPSARNSEVPTTVGQGGEGHVTRSAERASIPKPAAPSGVAGTPSNEVAKVKRPAGDLAPRQVRILDAIAWCCEYLRRTSVERNIVAWIAETSPRSSSYANDLGALRTRGLVDYPASGCLALTADGLAIADVPAAPGSRDELWRKIAAKLPPRQVRIVEALFDVDAVFRADLAAKLHISASSSSFANDLGALRTLGLIDYPQSGAVGLGRVWQ